MNIAIKVSSFVLFYFIFFEIIIVYYISPQYIMNRKWMVDNKTTIQNHVKLHATYKVTCDISPDTVGNKET